MTQREEHKARPSPSAQMLLLLVARVFVALDSLYFTCVIIGIATGLNAAAKRADVAMRPIQ
jgi:hypothetical protein